MAVSILAGLACGVLSGLGIGGGSLLMVWLTAVVGLEQRTAQGINLLYFLPTAAAALIVHIRNRYVDWSVSIPAALCGSAMAGATALLAMQLDTASVRKCFGLFLIFVGLTELNRARKRETPSN